MQFSLFPAENIYVHCSCWCYYRYLGSKQPTLLAQLLSLMLLILILITYIPAWAIVILRLQDVFCFKTWFHIVILWVISSGVVIFYFWFLSKEASCQSALKWFNYFWVKIMYRKILASNIKSLLVFSRCYLGGPMCYHSANMKNVGSCWKYRNLLSFQVPFFSSLTKTGDIHLKSVVIVRYVKEGEQ